MKVLAVLWRVLRGLLLGLAVIVLFIEEWGWRPLTAFAARLARWPPLAWLEARIAASPRHLALLLFLAPALLLFPLKLAALWLIEQGRATLGVGLIVAAKVLGTAFVGRLFFLLERQLLSFPWFASAFEWWLRTKQRVLAVVRDSLLWRTLRVIRRAARNWWRRALHG
ncbi:MAG: hypothetical protein ACXWCU_02300 [Caldimonas sp.]